MKLGFHYILAVLTKKRSFLENLRKKLSVKNKEEKEKPTIDQTQKEEQTTFGIPLEQLFEKSKGQIPGLISFCVEFLRECGNCTTSPTPL
jgi:hypothetical protein